MTLIELKEEQVTRRIINRIAKYPNSDTAIAYRLGMKEKEVQMQPMIDAVLHKLGLKQ
jgi:hypothetical protein